MSLRINLNSAALNAHRQLQATDNQMASSIEKLSSGYRINRSADDPAGLVISENLRSQVSGLGQAISNSQDAINMVKTAEGALTEVHSLLRTMRDLAVHASNVGMNDSKALEADQAQISSAITALNRIAVNTQFGTKKLLNGTAGVSGQTTNSDVMFMSGTAATAAGTYTLAITTQATKATNTGATAVGATAIAAGDTITINGQQIALTVGEDATSVANKINAQTDKTNVVATVSSGTLTLTQKSYGPSNAIVLSGTGTGLAATGLTAATVAGKNVAGTLTKGGVTYTLTGSGDLLYGNINTDTEGMVIKTAAAAGAAGDVVVTNNSLKFQVGANAGQTASVALSDVSASKLGASAEGLTNAGWKVADIDVTTFAGAQDAIKLLDAAISEVSATRSELGSFQKNQLESNINSLGVAKENIASSESSIRDADMAAEMVNFTRNQIMSQAGTAMLTQANQAPQNLLSLLR